jgi:hypothetical protein
MDRTGPVQTTGNTLEKMMDAKLPPGVDSAGQ